MTYSEAMSKADGINERCDNLTAKVVRILPESIDPAKLDDPNDSGWDVEVTVH